jgi:hypothetical protein
VRRRGAAGLFGGHQLVERLAGGAEAHETADNVRPGALQECRGDRGIDAAGHGDENFFAREIHVKS